jgi:pimeloyl-ACP methyl ester carboxylesterase
MTHLEFDFESQIWRHLYRELSRDHRLIRYDTRGNGLSDREVEDVSLETLVSDLEAVVEAADIEHFAVFGISQGCAISIAYAVRQSGAHYSSAFVGRIRARSGDARRNKGRKGAIGGNGNADAFGLGPRKPGVPLAVHVAIHSGRYKGAGDWFNELERISTSPDDAVRHRIATGNFDVRTLLAQVSVPTWSCTRANVPAGTMAMVSSSDFLRAPERPTAIAQSGHSARSECLPTANRKADGA